MRTGHLNRIISLIVVGQLLFTPVAFAQSAGEVITGFLQQMMGAQQAQLAQIESQQRSIQRQTLIDPTSCGTGKCVSEIFPNCQILRAMPTITEQSSCRSDLDPSTPSDQPRFYEALSVYNDYLQLETTYRNFAVESTQNSNTGISCLTRAATDLENRLIAREQQIDDLIRRMKEAQDTFKQQFLLPELTKIEDAQALLLGNSFTGRKGALEQNSVKFGDSFKDNNCAAVLSESEFETTGKSKGLMGIQERMQSVTTAKQGAGAGSFSAAEFTATTANNLRSQINNISSSISNDIKNNGPEGLATSAQGINDIYGLISNARLIPAILAEQGKEDVSFRKGLTNKVGAYSAGDSQSLSQALFANNDEEFELAINTYKLGKESECFQSTTNIQNLLAGTIRMRREGASSAATSTAENAYLDQLRPIITNPNSTIEQKLAEVRSLTSSESNSLYYLEMRDTLVTTNSSNTTDSIKVSKKLTPAAFIELHANNCLAQMNAKNGKTYSTNEMLNQYRKTRAEYTAYRKALPNKVSAAITNRLVNCADSVQASGTGVGTCSAADLSTSSATFCVTRAQSCSGKMNACYAQSKQIVNTVTARRDASVGVYKNAVARNKAQLQGMYAEVNRILAIESLGIQNSPLRQALVLPTDVKLSLDFSAKDDKGNFVKGLDSLEIEDPDKYLTRTVDNLEKVKRALEDQRNNIMNGNQNSALKGVAALAGGVTGHIEKIKENMQNALKESEKAKNECDKTVRGYARDYKRATQEQQRVAAESAGAVNDFCSNYNSLAAGPTCDDDFFDEMSEIGRRAGGSVSGNNTQVRQFKKYCSQFNNQGEAGSDKSVTPVIPTLAIAVAKAKKEAGLTESYDDQEDFSDAACATTKYASNPACKSWNARNVLCEASKEASDKKYDSYKDKLPGLLLSYNRDLSKCADSEGKPNVTIDKACIEQLDKLQTSVSSTCRKDFSALAKAVVEAIGTKERSVASVEDEDLAEKFSQLGEGKSLGCGAMDNSGSNFVREFTNTLQQSTQPAGALGGG